MPQFSILIAAYNAGRFMQSALDCVRAQTLADWELIVVEDGSHDETERIVKAFAASVSQTVVYENLGVNRGVAAARNRLLALARGEAVAFLDADDLWLPDHLQSLCEQLANGEALAISGIEIWDGENNHSIEKYLPSSVQIAQPQLGLFQESFIQTSTCVALPRASIERAGQFDESLRIGEDRDYWFRILQGNHRLGCTDRITCRYTKHSASSMTKTLRVAADTVHFYEKHFHAADIPASLRKSLLASALAVHARLIRRETPRKARALVFRALALQPLNLHSWALLFLTLATRTPSSLPSQKP